MEIVENVALITLNETMVALVISFLIFLYLFNRIMIRPLQNTMRERDHYVKDIQTQIANSHDQLSEMNRQLKEKEKTVLTEADSQREKLKDEGNVQAEKILEEARQEIHQIREKNKESINQEVAEARQYIADESEKLAATIMESILERGVSRG